MLFKIITGLVIIVALVLGGVFYYGYQNQNNAVKDMSAKLQSDKNTLAVVNKSTEGINAEIAGLKAKVDSMQEDLAAASISVPDKFNPNDLVKSAIFQGSDIGVTVIPLSNGDWQKIKIGSHEYQVLRMRLQVNGTQQKLLTFIRSMNIIYNTLVYESITINYYTPTPTATPSPTPSVTPTPVYLTKTEMNLAIYAR